MRGICSLSIVIFELVLVPLFLFATCDPDNNELLNYEEVMVSLKLLIPSVELILL